VGREENFGQEESVGAGARNGRITRKGAQKKWETEKPGLFQVPPLAVRLEWGESRGWKSNGQKKRKDGTVDIRLKEYPSETKFKKGGQGVPLGGDMIVAFLSEKGTLRPAPEGTRRLGGRIPRGN